MHNQDGAEACRGRSNKTFHRVCIARKWILDLLDRNDLVALTERAAKVTGIQLVEEAIERILG